MPSRRHASRACGLAILLVLVLVGSMDAAELAVADRCRQAAETLIGGLAGRGSLPPGWANATAENASSPRPGWYVCRMTRGRESAGYVLLAERDGGVQVVMFSGSGLPEGLAAGASPPGVSIPAVPDSFPAGRPVAMIAPIDEMPKIGTVRVTTTPLASCLASVLAAAQTPAGSVPPLFVEYLSTDEYWHRVVPLLEAAGMKPAAGLIQDNRYLLDRRCLDRLGEYQAKRLAVLRDPGLYEQYGSSYGGKEGVKAFDAYSGVAKSYLVGRISPWERVKALSDESIDAEGLALPMSEGMQTAFLLERRYLSGAKSIKDALGEFARTRGFTVAMERKPPSQVTAEDLPCLLLGPKGQAVVLLALSRDSGWALICVPETVVPVQLRAPKAQRFPGQPSLPGSRGLASRPVASAPEADWLRLYDPPVSLPSSLDCGAHLVATAILDAQWQALVLGAWKPLDNWDLDYQEEPTSRPAARPAVSPPPAKPRMVQRAQLRLLELMNQGKEDENRERMIRDHIEIEVNYRGVPRESFDPVELKRVATTATLDIARRFPRCRPITEACQRYGIDPEELYSLLPPRKTDAVGLFKEYLRAESRKTLEAIHSEPLDRESVKGIIAVAEEAGPAALPAAAKVLSEDWSQVGRAYLCGKLSATMEAKVARVVLDALAQRRQVDVDALGEFVDATTDEELLNAAFEVAETSLSAPQAQSFLLKQLNGRQQRRELALRVLGNRAGDATSAIVSLVKQETVPERQIGLLRNLGTLAGDPRILSLLRDIIASDSSLEVRVAAVAAIWDHSITEREMRALPDGFMELISVGELRRITADGPKELREAVEAKIAGVAAERRQRDENRARMREQMGRLHTRPAR